MNNLIKGAFIVALILLIVGYSEQTYAQRCGGWMQYIVRDETGAIKDPERVGLKVVRISTTEYETKNSVGSIGSIKTVFIQTRCGVSLAEIRLQNESRVMLLRFQNLPAETNFFVDSLPFQAGTFEIDFKGDMRLGSQELNREGLKNKDGKLLLSGTARSGYLVSASNWKRTSAQR